jgi:hypothetical protein
MIKKNEIIIVEYYLKSMLFKQSINNKDVSEKIGLNLLLN